jgi:hypothetical protein
MPPEQAARQQWLAKAAKMLLQAARDLPAGTAAARDEWVTLATILLRTWAWLLGVPAERGVGENLQEVLSWCQLPFLRLVVALFKVDVALSAGHKECTWLVNAAKMVAAYGDQRAQADSEWLRGVCGQPPQQAQEKQLQAQVQEQGHQYGQGGACSQQQARQQHQQELQQQQPDQQAQQQQPPNGQVQEQGLQKPAQMPPPPPQQQQRQRQAEGNWLQKHAAREASESDMRAVMEDLQVGVVSPVD